MSIPSSLGFPRLAAGLFLAACTAAPAASPAWLTAHDDEVRAIVARMTLAEKAGQMAQPLVSSLGDLSEIRTLALGSVFNGGTSDPPGGNSPAAWRKLADDCQAQAANSRLGIPLLHGIDAVHGHNNVEGAVIFPHNIGLGSAGSAELVERIARVTAAEVAATGIRWAFAPCVAVPRDIRWGRTYEGYSEDPALTATLGVAAVRGLQGSTLGSRGSVLACAKHFIADGGTAFRSARGGGLLDQGDARLDEAALRSVHLPAFAAAVDAGVGSIMPSFSSLNGEKCSGSGYLLTDVLKKELGFEGFLISDYNAIDQIVPVRRGSSVTSNNASGQVRSANYKKCVEISINAGMDMVMVTDHYKDFIRFVQELVAEGKVPVERVDDAVTRILRVKHAMGLMDAGKAAVSDRDAVHGVGSASHRAVAREAVRRSLVLLKNDGALPLAASAKRIHVSGRGADDLGMQCGGWTISWQGAMGNVTPGGTTILDGLRAAAGEGVTITTAPAEAAGADVAVVVIGETPYAEAKGDRAEPGVAPEDIAAFEKARATGAPVVLVILSGRPLVLGPLADQADAIVAAWLPGTEGAGVADVLFGSHPPVGKLSFAWPADLAQIPRGHAKEPKESLYPLGHGMSYAVTSAVER